jgi:O-antigen/teichoic acid export membrane protein
LPGLADEQKDRHEDSNLPHMNDTTSEGTTESRRWAGHLIQNALALMVSSGGTAVLGIAFWTTAAHLASAQNIGRASAEIAAMTLLANLAQLSFGSIFDRFLPVAGSRTRTFVTRAYAICTSVGLMAALVYLLAGFGHNFIPSSAGWRILFVAAVALWTIFILQDSVLTGLRATRWVPVENILFAIAKLALLPVGLLLTTRQGLFLAWSIPVLGATGAVSFYLFKKRIPQHEASNATIEDLPSAREIVVLAFAQYAQSLISVFTPSIVVLIVIQRLGPVQEARYYLPALMANGVALFLWNLNTSFLVESSRDRSALRQHANDTIRAALIVILPTVGIGVALAPEVLRIFGSGYAQHGTTLLRLLLLALPGTAVTAFYSAFAWLDKRVWRLAVREVASAAIYFSVLLTFIGHFGILAIGIAAVVASGLQGIFFLPISVKRYRETAPDQDISSSRLALPLRDGDPHPETERELPGLDPAVAQISRADNGADPLFDDTTLLKKLVTRRTVSMALVAVDVTMLILTLAHIHGPARLVLGLILGAFIPGWSLIGPFKLANPALEVSLAVAMSFVILMLTAQVLITVHEWHLLGLEEVICVLCLPSLLWQSRPAADK